MLNILVLLIMYKDAFIIFDLWKYLAWESDIMDRVRLFM